MLARRWGAALGKATEEDCVSADPSHASAINSIIPRGIAKTWGQFVLRSSSGAVVTERTDGAAERSHPSFP